MRTVLLTLLLVTTGCATHHARREAGFRDHSDAAEDHDFFYGHWWKPTPSDDDAEDRAFFLGSHH
ncbi:MAG: hypothetical protein QOD99_1845 [Chthoniobacter sp.]|jgi:hypothetical protein|nr:hypothetical protein [Chthoniobacter sp.]